MIPVEIKQLLAGRLNDTVEQLEPWLLSKPQRDIPVEESFTPCTYTRQILIPADTILTGRVWLDDYVDIMVYGHIIVATPDGVKELTGYNKLDGKGGRKRIGYAIEDTLWITVHKFDAGRCKNALQQLSVCKMQEYHDIITAKSVTDFEVAFGQFAAEIRAESECTRNRIDLNLPTVMVAPSMIEGKGLFAAQDFIAGTVIMPARLKGLKTEAGRYSNHSIAPNARMVLVEDDVVLQATSFISKGSEITTNYVDTLVATRSTPCQE